MPAGVFLIPEKTKEGARWRSLSFYAEKSLPHNCEKPVLHSRLCKLLKDILDGRLANFLQFVAHTLRGMLDI